MSTEPLEKNITNSILRYLRQRPRSFTRKLEGGMSSSGLPDVEHIEYSKQLGEARIFFFEVKRPKSGKLTKLQEITLAELSDVGANCAVVSSAKQVKEFLGNFK